MVLPAEALHGVDHHSGILRRRKLRDAMAEIEYVAAALAVAGEDCGNFTLDGSRGR